MPARRAVASAPVRAADAGGWTDTWFAGHGTVCNVTVGPAVEVIVEAVDGPAGRVTLDAVTFGDRYAFALDAPPGRHPLLEATLRRWAPRAGALGVGVASAVPPGSGLGTSASVVVALLGALDALAGGAPGAGGPCPPGEIARRAHEVETVELGWQSGVQDQAAAATGGALRIDVDYPRADVHRIAVPPPAWEALCDRLVTVYLGRPHRSSAVHEQVIASLGDDRGRARLDPLRRAGADAAGALAAGDLSAYGAALTAATEGQRALHPDLVSADADAVAAAARAAGALGWKVNGAGGAGGTVTLLAGDGGGESLRRAVAAAAARAGAPWAVLDLRPTERGLDVAVR